MSESVAANATSLPASSFFPPPGTNWLATINSAVVFLMIGATLGAMSVVMLLALLFFSTSAVHRKPIFILKIIAICIGIADAALNVYKEIISLEYPNKALNPASTIVVGLFSGYAPIYVDCVLLI
ncbi:hypothetical protein OF83DRAFT_1172806 [Amylostereum chailletii]|nr:hypothetical protein OF83DRAFT_1172806 [Amylostereum chailletii]